MSSCDYIYYNYYDFNYDDDSDYDYNDPKYWEKMHSRNRFMYNLQKNRSEKKSKDIDPPKLSKEDELASEKKSKDIDPPKLSKEDELASKKNNLKIILEKETDVKPEFKSNIQNFIDKFSEDLKTNDLKELIQIYKIGKVESCIQNLTKYFSMLDYDCDKIIKNMLIKCTGMHAPDIMHGCSIGKNLCHDVCLIIYLYLMKGEHWNKEKSEHFNIYRMITKLCDVYDINNKELDRYIDRDVITPSRVAACFPEITASIFLKSGYMKIKNIARLKLNTIPKGVLCPKLPLILPLSLTEKLVSLVIYIEFLNNGTQNMYKNKDCLIQDIIHEYNSNRINELTRMNISNSLGLLYTPDRETIAYVPSILKANKFAAIKIKSVYKDYNEESIVSAIRSNSSPEEHISLPTENEYIQKYTVETFSGDNA